MSRVSLVRVPEKPFDREVYDAIRAAVDLLGGAQAFARPGDRVLVKPNWWCWPGKAPTQEAFYLYGTTDRRIVYGASRLFAELGCRVAIGEDPGANRSVKDVYAGFRAEELAQQAGVELVDLRAAGYRTVPAPRGREFTELRISRIALEADLIVSIPVMKSHMLTGVTLTLKNMKGVIPPVEKRAFHQRNLSQGVADLSTVVAPGLTIVDAIIASDNWVVGGGVRPMGLIVAGADPVATDSVCCHLMQADPHKIDHLRFAYEQGVGELDLEKIEVVGEQISTFSVPFALPADPFQVARELGNVEIVAGDTCSGCLNRLGDVFMQMGKESLAQCGELAFLVGKGVEPPAGKKTILMGICTVQHKDKGVYLPYCPPMASDVIQAIRFLDGQATAVNPYWDSFEVSSE